MNTMFFNAGGLTEHKQKAIALVIKSLQLDVVIIVDTRIVEERNRNCRHNMKLMLGCKYRTQFLPTVKTDDFKLIGGMMIITSDRVTNLEITQLIHLGTLAKIQFKFGLVPISIIAVYMPNINPNQGSLQSQLKKQLKVDDVQKHIRNSIEEHILMAQAEAHNIIVGGDFNSDLNDNDKMKMKFLLTNLNMQHSANESQLLQATYVRGEPGSKHFIVSRPDHILHYGKDIISKSCNVYDHTAFLNDHKPLITSFEVINQKKPHYQVLNAVKRIKYDPSNSEQKAVFLQSLEEADTYIDAEPEVRLQNITRDTVNIIKHFDKSKRSKRGTQRSNWSPMNQALECQLEAIASIRRRVFGFRSTKKLNNRNYIKVLALIRKQWRLRLRRVARNEQQYIEFLQASEYNVDFWENIPFNELSSIVVTAFKHTKILLAHKLRKQRFAEFREAISKREFNFQLNELGSVIKSVMGSKRIYYSMEELRVEGERLIEPGQIHKILTDNFEKWFETPEAELLEDWPRALTDHNAFITMCGKQQLPANVAQKLWESVSKRPENSIHFAHFKSSVMMTPTIEEFMEVVKSSKSGSAAGMSDLSYDMVKAWPKETMQAVHQSLAQLWENKTIPEDWKWKWMNPIPKAVDPTINELRPLCLIEVMRKLWSVIFV